MASIAEWQKVLQWKEEMNKLNKRVQDLENKVAKLEPKRGRPVTKKDD